MPTPPRSATGSWWVLYVWGRASAPTWWESRMMSGTPRSASSQANTSIQNWGWLSCAITSEHLQAVGTAVEDQVDDGQVGDERPGPALGVGRALEVLEDEFDPVTLELGDVEVVLPVDSGDVGVGPRRLAHRQHEAGRLSRDAERRRPVHRLGEPQDPEDQLDEGAGHVAEVLPGPVVELAEAVRVGLEVRRPAVVPLEGPPVLAGPGGGAVDLGLADLLGELALREDGNGKPVPS